MIDKGCKLNIQNISGDTALILAVDSNNTDMAKLLIDNDCDLNIKDGYGNTALMLAILRNKIEIAKFLIDKRCNLNLQNKNGNTALMVVIKYSKIDIAKLLIDKGCDLNIQDKNGHTALILAAARDEIDIAKLLIEKECNLNLQNNDGNTALMIAIQYNKTYMSKLLIEKGCNLNLQDKFGSTALMIAVFQDKIDIAKLLIDNGCDLKLKDKNGLTILDIIKQQNLNNKILSINSILDIDTLYIFIKFKLNENNKNNLYETKMYNFIIKNQCPIVLDEFSKNYKTILRMNVSLGNELHALVGYLITGDIKYYTKLRITFDKQSGINAGGLSRQFFNSVDTQLIFYFIKKNFNKKLSDFKKKLSDFSKTNRQKKERLLSEFNTLLEEYSKINLNYSITTITNFNNINPDVFDENYLKEDMEISLETLIKILALSAYNGNPIIYNEIFDGNKYEIIIDNIIKEFGIKNKLKKLIIRFYLHNLTEKKKINIDSIKSISNNYESNNNYFINKYNKNNNNNINNNEFIELINKYYNNSPYNFYLLHMIDLIISKEKLIERLVFRFDRMSNPNSTNFKNKMIDIFNKFTDKDIEKFNFAISGSKKMCPRYEINVHLGNAERIEFHTCFFRMDIYISNQEELIKKKNQNELIKKKNQNELIEKRFKAIRNSMVENNSRFTSE